MVCDPFALLKLKLCSSFVLLALETLNEERHFKIYTHWGQRDSTAVWHLPYMRLTQIDPWHPPLSSPGLIPEYTARRNP